MLSSFHLPTSLCSTPVTALLRSYGGSDSRPPFNHTEGYPRFTSPECVLSFCAQPPCVLPCPLSAHSFVLAFWGRYHRAVSSLRPPVLSASPLVRRLAKTQGRIGFLIVRTDRFAFRCSPPRLPATQLRLAFNQSSVWLRVFPPPLQVRSRAHERRRPAGWFGGVSQPPCGGRERVPKSTVWRWQESGGAASSPQGGDQ